MTDLKGKMKYVTLGLLAKQTRLICKSLEEIQKQ
jgi:hypothetical protein